MRWIAPLLLTMLLTGCNTVGTQYIHACPVPKEYTAQEKARAKDEARMLPPGSEIGSMLEDYAVLAQQARDCWSH